MFAWLSASDAAITSAQVARRVSSSRMRSTGASALSKPRTSSARKAGKPEKPSVCAKRLAVATETPVASASSSMVIVAVRNECAST